MGAAYAEAVPEDAGMGELPNSRCPRCGGSLTATHMLLATYPLDARQRWHRRLADLTEEVIVACVRCGQHRAGEVLQCGEAFHFVPASGLEDKRGEG